MKNKYICMLKINVNFLNMWSKVKLGQMFKGHFFFKWKYFTTFKYTVTPFQVNFVKELKVK